MNTNTDITTTPSTRFSRKRITAGVLAAAIGLSIAAAGPVEAKGGDATIVRGTCSNGATWKLKGKPDSGMIELEFEVDTNRIGQVWNVTVTDNATTVFNGTRATLAPSGSFSVERRTPNQAGTDRITAVATRNGNTCRASLNV